MTFFRSSSAAASSEKQRVHNQTVSLWGFTPLMKITSITTVLILTFAGIAGLSWPGTEGFVLSCSAQSMVKDFEQSHLIPPKMQTKLEISRQAELFPSFGFFQPRKVVLFCAIVRVAAE